MPAEARRIGQISIPMQLIPVEPECTAKELLRLACFHLGQNLDSR